MVHRDIHYNNFIIHNGHLLLVDFQIAVQKVGYRELGVYRDPLSLLNNRGYHIYSVVAWDDAHTLLQILQLIGSAPLYETRYAEIEQEITDHIGKDTIWYLLPSKRQLMWESLLFRLKSLFYLNPKKKKKYRYGANVYQFLTAYADVAPHTRQFPTHNEFEEIKKMKELW